MGKSGGGDAHRFLGALRNRAEFCVTRMGKNGQIRDHV
jgi:hypothetical protein